MESNGVRKRIKNHKKEVEHFPGRLVLKNDFVPRESLLTELFRSSLHIRAIYHIFVAILVMLFLDTVIYDFIERGKINVGISTVVNGFGDVTRAARLWLFELAVALAFYPAFRLYAVGIHYLQPYPRICRIWNIAAIVGLIGLQATLLGVPLWAISREHLALASSITVTCEMFRFAMKIHAVTAECLPRCWNPQGPPMPSLRHYVYFLFAPTLLYRDQYPRTTKIRWSLVIFHFTEVAAIVFYNSFLWERFILPYWSDYGKEKQLEAGVLVRGMFACVLPGVISFLCGFYCLLHAWHNAFAEMLTFADRLFYEDWWTQSQYSRYYRSWNLVVHSWLREYIYKPLAPRAGRFFATFLVFFVSAVAHETVLTTSFGFMYPVLLIEFGVFGLLCVPLTGYGGQRYPSAYNFLMWLSFFFGNGILWSLYPMEYFARKNCPSSESDSFFAPKSWSCPEVVLKPNWTFHNPFSLIH